MQLAEEKVQALTAFAQAHDLDKTQMAKLVGIPRSTYRETILKLNNVSKGTEEKINRWLASSDEEKTLEQPVESRRHSVDKPQGLMQITSSIPMPHVTGGEKPELGHNELIRILCCFENGAGLVIPSLKTLLNADVGSREEFRKKFGNVFNELHAFVLALASESARADILDQLKKPRF